MCSCNFACKGHPQNDHTVSGGTLNPIHSLIQVAHGMHHWTNNVIRVQLLVLCH